MPFSLSAGLESASIISPGVTIPTLPITCLKIMNGFYRALVILSFLFPKAWRLLIGYRDVICFLALSPLFPKQETYIGPHGKSDAYQTLFTDIYTAETFLTPENSRQSRCSALDSGQRGLKKSNYLCLK